MVDSDKREAMTAHSNFEEPDGTGLIRHDPWLAPYAAALRHRYQCFRRALQDIDETEGSLADLATGHRYFGFNRGKCDSREGVWYREWAPAADALYLIGDFNDWDRRSHPMQRDRYGVWSIFLPDDGSRGQATHESRVKVHVLSKIGPMDRVPAYITRAVQDQQTLTFAGQIWDPPNPYRWQHHPPPIRGGLRIYEAHVGMAQEEQRVGTYLEFAEQVLSRIASAGYNAVQLMAVQEHPYYASFGYHVSSFFAPASRFGTPDELRQLIDHAHSLGLFVLLDVVHSHSVKNLHDGISMFDGCGHQYFHDGPRGDHPAWDSRLFDYAKREVLRFLLSNLRYWLEEFHFDGFRFDGVTSMMYLHHGLGHDFGSYDDYLINDIDESAVTYLQLANQLVKQVNPLAITVAEDVSGMVGLARPLDEGGLGFDYRLAMGLPDYWIKLLKEKRDQDWSMAEIFNTMMNRRRHEKHIAYAESHDQALVGDKTLAFRLMDADMYWHMDKNSQNAVIERGIALHKMIRLVTFASGGEGYLTFMGNEFGHPEWVDFPREGNADSFKHARRQWSLVDDPGLRYGELAAFDQAMLALDEQFDLLDATEIVTLNLDEANQILIFARGGLVFVFNFQATTSQTDYRFAVPQACDHRLILNTDAEEFGGHAFVKPNQTHSAAPKTDEGHENCIQIYIPARSAQVLAPTSLMPADRAACPSS